LTSLPEIVEPYAVQYATIMTTKLPEPGCALLVEGNVLTDPELQEWLRSFGQLDVIVCWCIGIHQAVHFNTLLGYRNTKEETYRLRVQNAFYDFAGNILRPTGLLHIVDRLGSDSRDQRESIAEAHREQASLSPSMTIEELDVRPYAPRNHHQQTPLSDRAGNSALGTDLFLCTVVARRS